MKVSIITVNLNNLRGLCKTLESVLAQDSSLYEWIVIDGGSTDGSRELIEQNQDKMTYWVSEPDKGIFDAMNKGIKKATGDYLLFLNSGDYLVEECTIRKFINFGGTGDVIYGNTIVVDNFGNVDHKRITPSPLKFSSFFKGGISHQAAFIKRTCFKEKLYNMHIGSDTEHFIMLVAHGYSFEKFNEFVAYYNNCGISSTIDDAQYHRLVVDSLPFGAREDYEDIMLFQEVDLAIMIKKIIHSQRIIRNITRLFIYPIYYISNMFSK